MDEIEFNENESVNTVKNLISDLIDKVVLNETCELSKVRLQIEEYNYRSTLWLIEFSWW